MTTRKQLSELSPGFVFPEHDNTKICRKIATHNTVLFPQASSSPTRCPPTGYPQPRLSFLATDAQPLVIGSTGFVCRL